MFDSYLSQIPDYSTDYRPYTTGSGNKNPQKDYSIEGMNLTTRENRINSSYITKNIASTQNYPQNSFQKRNQNELPNQ